MNDFKDKYQFLKRSKDMYFKKCGTQINDNAVSCPNCGTSISKASALVKSKSTMIVVILLTIVISISPFIKMYYVEFFEQTDFSVSSMLETTSEIIDFGNSVGAEIHLTDLKLDEMSDEGKIVFFVIVFDLIMFIIGFAELLVEAIYIVSIKEYSERKLWKAAISSAIVFFTAHLIIFIAIFLINSKLNESLGDYGGNAKIMGVHAIQYVFQIIAVITYIIANVKYASYKKDHKKNSKLKEGLCY